MPQDFKTQYGFWSYFIYPTACAESKGSYICLNTHDRARFTFSFMQYAAHVPNGDFVLFFKELLALPKASEYFPKLALKDNRIFYKNGDSTVTQLESDATTDGLLNYLNPILNSVEDQELICAARMVHWATNDIAHRDIQVKTAVEHFRNAMKQYDTRFKLNGAPAKVCQMIADIRHQGRGTNDRIANALNTNGDFDKAFDNLCTIGDNHYQTRIDTVRATIQKLLKDGTFAMKYQRSTGTFVNI